MKSTRDELHGRDEHGSDGCFGIAIGCLAALVLWGFVALFYWLSVRGG